MILLLLLSLQDSDNSYDYVDNDPDPTPGVDGDTMRQYGHGTSCAGVVAMAKDNELCGTGVAFGSKVAGDTLRASPIST